MADRTEYERLTSEKKRKLAELEELLRRGNAPNATLSDVLMADWAVTEWRRINAQEVPPPVRPPSRSATPPSTSDSTPLESSVYRSPKWGEVAGQRPDWALYGDTPVAAKVETQSPEGPPLPEGLGAQWARTRDLRAKNPPRPRSIVEMPRGAEYGIRVWGVDPAVAAETVAVAERLNMDPVDLFDVIGIESDWNPQAAASEGTAKGLLQFIDSSAREVGLRNSTEMQQLPAIEQLPYIEKYFRKRFKAHGLEGAPSRQDVFTTTFVGKPVTDLDADMGDLALSKNKRTASVAPPYDRLTARDYLIGAEPRVERRRRKAGTDGADAGEVDAGTYAPYDYLRLPGTPEIPGPAPDETYPMADQRNPAGLAAEREKQLQRTSTDQGTRLLADAKELDLTGGVTKGDAFSADARTRVAEELGRAPNVAAGTEDQTKTPKDDKLAGLDAKIARSYQDAKKQGLAARTMAPRAPQEPVVASNLKQAARELRKAQVKQGLARGAVGLLAMADVLAGVPPSQAVAQAQRMWFPQNQQDPEAAAKRMEMELDALKLLATLEQQRRRAVEGLAKERADGVAKSKKDHLDFLSKYMSEVIGATTERTKVADAELGKDIEQIDKELASLDGKWAEAQRAARMAAARLPSQHAQTFQVIAENARQGVDMETLLASLDTPAMQAQLAELTDARSRFGIDNFDPDTEAMAQVAYYDELDRRLRSLGSPVGLTEILEAGAAREPRVDSKGNAIQTNITPAYDLWRESQAVVDEIYTRPKEALVEKQRTLVDGIATMVLAEDTALGQAMQRTMSAIEEAGRGDAGAMERALTGMDQLNDMVGGELDGMAEQYAKLSGTPVSQVYDEVGADLERGAAEREILDLLGRLRGPADADEDQSVAAAREALLASPELKQTMARIGVNDPALAMRYVLREARQDAQASRQQDKATLQGLRMAGIAPMPPEAATEEPPEKSDAARLVGGSNTTNATIGTPAPPSGANTAPSTVVPTSPEQTEEQRASLIAQRKADIADMRAQMKRDAISASLPKPPLVETPMGAPPATRASSVPRADAGLPATAVQRPTIDMPAPPPEPPKIGAPRREPIPQLERAKAAAVENTMPQQAPAPPSPADEARRRQLLQDLLQERGGMTPLP